MKKQKRLGFFDDIILYEGISVPDGKYKLGQLSKEGKYARVVNPSDKYEQELYNEMPVMMDDRTCAYLFSYVKSRQIEISIKEFTATVIDHFIVHIE